MKGITLIQTEPLSEKANEKFIFFFFFFLRGLEKMKKDFEDCQKHLENLTPKKLKKEFLKGEIKESKFLLSTRF